jgi:hypothetical protein
MKEQLSRFCTWLMRRCVPRESLANSTPTWESLRASQRQDISTPDILTTLPLGASFDEDPSGFSAKRLDVVDHGIVII